MKTWGDYMCMHCLKYRIELFSGYLVLVNESIYISDHSTNLFPTDTVTIINVII